MELFKSFERFITPSIVKVLYWIGLIAVAVGAVVFLFSFLASGAREGAFGAIIGLVGGAIGAVVILVVGTLLVRIYCELIMLSFRIYDVLVEIRDKAAAPPSA